MKTCALYTCLNYIILYSSSSRADTRSIRQIIQHAAMFSLHRFKKSFNQAHFFPCLVIEIRFNVFAARIFKMCVINVSYD